VGNYHIRIAHKILIYSIGEIVSTTGFDAEKQ